MTYDVTEYIFPTPAYFREKEIEIVSKQIYSHFIYAEDQCRLRFIVILKHRNLHDYFRRKDKYFRVDYNILLLILVAYS